MELKNGYKVIYDTAANGEHVFSASKTGIFANAEEIVKVAAGEYKLVYEKAGKIYGSKTGVPAANDHHFTEFDNVFAEAVNEPAAANEEPVSQPIAEEPEANNETPIEVEEPNDGESSTEE